jgi:3-oxoacyl-[acyl-carrier-protein] synthase-1
MNRVVITGAGIYSSIGRNLEEVKESLFKGTSGVILDPERKAFGYQSGLTGKVERPQLKGMLDRRSRVCMPDHAEYAYISTLEAIKTAGLNPEYFDHNEVGSFLEMTVPLLPLYKARISSVKKGIPAWLAQVLFFNRSTPRLP